VNLLWCKYQLVKIVMQHFRVISAVCYFHYVFTNIVARFENLVYSRNEYFYSSKQLPLIYILFMKKQLIGIFSLAAFASSPLEVDVELINDTFDGSSNLTKNMGND